MRVKAWPGEVYRVVLPDGGSVAAGRAVGAGGAVACGGGGAAEVRQMGTILKGKQINENTSYKQRKSLTFRALCKGSFFTRTMLISKS